MALNLETIETAHFYGSRISVVPKFLISGNGYLLLNVGMKSIPQGSFVYLSTLYHNGEGIAKTALFRISECLVVSQLTLPYFEDE